MTAASSEPAAIVSFDVPDSAARDRLDRYLASRMTDRTRSFLRRLVVSGHVKIDGDVTRKPGARIEAGARVEVHVPAEHDGAPLAQDIPLSVIHEDDDILVVNKPAGLVVHPATGNRDGTLVNALLGRGTRLSPRGAPDRPGIVHRLDEGTSGVLVVAKNDNAHGCLSDAFARREVHKRYMALVWGRPSPTEGMIERSIGRSRSNRLKMAVGGRAGREAISRYTTAASMPGFALLDVEPESGRTHQIRVHLQSIHHPIVGDALYGGQMWKSVQDPVKRKMLREFERLALHAARLELTHPGTGERVAFTAPLPDDFEALLGALRGA